MKRVLIIDDEAPARAALRGLLREHADVALAGEAESIAEAQHLLGSADYDLVLLDIQLRGGLAFDLVPFVRPAARIVFVTAFDQHAIRAFEVNALDYLLKPVRAARLTEALGRMPASVPASFRGGSMKPDDLVYLKTGAGTTRFVAVDKLAVIEAEDNYSQVHLADHSRLMVRRTLKAWEDTLPSALFVRVHRGTIINLACYRGSDRESDETTLLRVEGVAAPVRASFRYLPELRTRLQAIGRRL